MLTVQYAHRFFTLGIVIFILAITSNFACNGDQTTARKPAATSESRIELNPADTLPPQTAPATQTTVPPKSAPTLPDSSAAAKDPRTGTPVLVEVIVDDPCRTAPLFINDQPALVLSQIKNVKKVQLVAGTSYRFRIGKMEKAITITAQDASGRYQVVLPCE
jgi:hypothetical protein